MSLYFPIEVSRTAAGPLSGWVFTAGMTLSMWLFYKQTTLTRGSHLILFGLTVLVLVEDKTNLIVHVLGGALLPIGTLWHVRLIARDDFDKVKRMRAYFVLLLALCLSLVRLVFKSYYVTKYELSPPAVSLNSIDDTELGFYEFFPIYARALCDADSRWAITEICLNIMFRGPDACINPEATMPAFYLGGVLQWMCIYLGTSVF